MARPPIAPAPENIIVQTRAPEVKTGLNTSKKWELPPRPKPGRKAKPRASPCHGHKTHNHGGGEDDHCGICTKESGCICAEVGLRPAPPSDHFSPASTLPTPKEIDFSNFEVKQAVPLNRVSKSRNSVSKFAKLPEIQPPTLDLPDSKCGFCTDHTPCICTGEGLKEEATESAPAGACEVCAKDSFSMLFCLGLSSSQPLPANVPSISCTSAYKTLKSHRNYEKSDMGHLVTLLQSSDRKVGLQSINEALKYLNTL